MKLSVLCSDPKHPVNGALKRWAERVGTVHAVELISRASEASGGDILFLISCAELVGAELRAKYRATLVIHASDLPEGRGWSPLVWQILEGKNRIKMTLLDADDRVDSGAIWTQRELRFEGHELFDEINGACFAVELELIDFAIENIDRIKPVPQSGEGKTKYRRRMPHDSQIDPSKSLIEQFDLLRVADPDRYPAFFDYRGYRYNIRIEKSARRERDK